MENRNLCSYVTPSLDARQEILAEEVPKLAKKAAMKAIKEWGQPISKITHLVFSTTSGVDMPGADYKLLNLLGLQPSVKRFMLYHVGCFAGAAILRLAKDLAENNAGARVLAVCSEISAVTFHGPSYNHIDSLVAQAILGDGAAAVVVGADPLREIEWPIFEIVSASQTIIPGSEGRIKGRLQEAGLVYHLLKDVPVLVSKNIHNYLKEAFGPLGVEDWNSIFWVAHPGGRAILDKVEEELKMRPERLAASRKVMREYGLMMSATVLFVMDEMRRRSAEEGAATTGEGLEWGVLLGFGPGLTVEMMVLRSLPLSQAGTL